MRIAERVVAEWMEHAKQRERLDLVNDVGDGSLEDFVAVRTGVAKRLMLLNIERDLRTKHIVDPFSITREELSEAIASCIATATD